MLAQPLGQAGGGVGEETRAALRCTARQCLDSWAAGRGPISSQGRGYPSHRREDQTRRQAGRRFISQPGQPGTQVSPWTMGQWALPQTQ